jgi:hypothetical protein
VDDLSSSVGKKREKKSAVSVFSDTTQGAPKNHCGYVEFDGPWRA